MDISWKEVLTISGIISIVSLFERWGARYLNFSKQRKKLRIYQAFKDSSDCASPEKILEMLNTEGLSHDLEGERIFDDSLKNRLGYRLRKTCKHLKGSILTKRYSIRTISQLEPLLYELVQEGMLKTDGEKYFRNR